MVTCNACTSFEHCELLGRFSNALRCETSRAALYLECSARMIPGELSLRLLSHQIWLCFGIYSKRRIIWAYSFAQMSFANVQPFGAKNWRLTFFLIESRYSSIIFYFFHRIFDFNHFALKCILAAPWRSK